MHTEVEQEPAPMGTHTSPDPRPILSLLLLLVLGGCGCGGCDTDRGGITPLPPTPGVKPDFLIEDVNPNSTTFGGGVSPRQFLTRVSVWYFGHAT